MNPGTLILRHLMYIDSTKWVTYWGRFILKLTRYLIKSMQGLAWHPRIMEQDRNPHYIMQFLLSSSNLIVSAECRPIVPMISHSQHTSVYVYIEMRIFVIRITNCVDLFLYYCNFVRPSNCLFKSLCLSDSELMCIINIILLFNGQSYSLLTFIDRANKRKRITPKKSRLTSLLRLLSASILESSGVKFLA